MTASIRPREPPPTTLAFPPPDVADEYGRVAIGGDLEPGTILAAYRAGLFPMPLFGQLTWWSPDPRGVLLPHQLHVSRRLRRTLRTFEIRVDTAFDEVIAACMGRGPAEEEWITDEIRDAYSALHRLGWAHSIEAWTRPTAGGPTELAGGLYGLAIGGLFAGESMFHRRTDASKAALVGLVERFRADGSAGGDRLIDVQWQTPHLATLGVGEMRRAEYLERLAEAMRASPPVL